MTSSVIQWEPLLTKSEGASCEFTPWTEAKFPFLMIRALEVEGEVRFQVVDYVKQKEKYQGVPTTIDEAIIQFKDLIKKYDIGQGKRLYVQDLKEWKSATLHFLSSGNTSKRGLHKAA